MISFLETGVDKNVRYLETATDTFWDNHEWQDDKLVVKSLRQPKGGAVELISFVEVDKDTLSAKFFKSGSLELPTQLQCRQWEPKSSNKGINLSF